MYNVTCFMTVWLGTVSEFSTYFLFFSLCFYRRNFAKSLIFPDWLRSSNDSKQICRYPSCKVFLARWLLHITFLFYGDSNFVYTWLFQQDCVRVYQALHRLPSFIEILAGYEGNHQGLIRDCFSTPLKVIYILSILFLFCFLLFAFFFVPYPNNGMKSRSVYFIHVSFPLPWIQLHCFFSKVNSKHIINIIVFECINIPMRSPLSYMVLW